MKKGRRRITRKVAWFSALAVLVFFSALELVLHLVPVEASKAYLFLLHSHDGRLPLFVPVENPPEHLGFNPVTGPTFLPITIPPRRLAPGKRLVCFGSSSVRGPGEPGPHTFPFRLSTLTGFEVVNLGGAG